MPFDLTKIQWYTKLVSQMQINAFCQNNKTNVFQSASSFNQPSIKTEIKHKLVLSLFQNVKLGSEARRCNCFSERQQHLGDADTDRQPVSVCGSPAFPSRSN